MKLKNISRAEQLEWLRRRYAGRGPEGKGWLLDELCEQHGYHRKHAIRLLNGSAVRRKSPPGPPRQYEGIKEVVGRIWVAGEQPCGKRLAQMLPLWLPHYQRRYGKLLPSQRKLTDQISPATLDRLLAPMRSKHLRGLSGTKPGSLLRQQIPIQGEVWDENRAGFLEADSVAHCGSSLAGQLCMEPDLHRYCEHLDQRPGGVEPWCHRGFRANTAGRAEPAVYVARIGF